MPPDKAEALILTECMVTPLHVGIGENMKKHLHGFTFIELLTGMVLVSVLAAIVVPHYVDAAQQAKDDSLWIQSVTVKNTHNAIMNRGDPPTVVNLTAEIPTNAIAVANGVQVPISGMTYVVPTYSNALCTKPTQSVNDEVRCVGAIASY